MHVLSSEELQRVELSGENASDVIECYNINLILKNIYHHF
jgi:hypothetical protein